MKSKSRGIHFEWASNYEAETGEHVHYMYMYMYMYLTKILWFSPDHFVYIVKGTLPHKNTVIFPWSFCVYCKRYITSQKYCDFPLIILCIL
jgi:hypothetical protein